MSKRFKNFVSKTLIFSILSGGSIPFSSKAFIGFHKEDTRYIEPNPKQIKNNLGANFNYTQDILLKRCLEIVTYIGSWVAKYRRFLDQPNNEGSKKIVKEILDQTNKKPVAHRCDLWIIKPFVNHLWSYYKDYGEDLIDMFGEDYINKIKFYTAASDKLSNQFMNTVCGTPEQQRKALAEFTKILEEKVHCPVCIATAHHWAKLLDISYSKCYFKDGSITYKLGFIDEALENLSISLKLKDLELKNLPGVYKFAEDQEKQNKLKTKTKKSYSNLNVSSYTDQKEIDNKDKILKKEELKKQEEIKLQEKLNNLRYYGPAYDYDEDICRDWKIVVGNNKALSLDGIECRDKYKGNKVTTVTKVHPDNVQGQIGLNNAEFNFLKKYTKPDYLSSNITSKISSFIEDYEFGRQYNLNSISADALKGLSFYNADELDLKQLGLEAPNYEVIFKQDGNIKSHSIIVYDNFLRIPDESSKYSGGIFISRKLSDNKRLIIYLEGLHYEKNKRGRNVLKTAKVRYFICDHYNAEKPWYEVDMNKVDD